MYHLYFFAVNGEYITACKHDDAVNILRNAGDIVVLTVKHYRAATPFLQKQGMRSNDFKIYTVKNVKFPVIRDLFHTIMCTLCVPFYRSRSSAFLPTGEQLAKLSLSL